MCSAGGYAGIRLRDAAYFIAGQQKKLFMGSSELGAVSNLPEGYFFFFFLLLLINTKNKGYETVIAVEKI